MPQSIRLLFCFTFLAFFISCGNGEVFTPKPKGYNRIELEPHEYRTLEDGHPYSFEYSTQAIVEPDTFDLAEPHWIVVHYPEYGARIQFTYKPLNGDLDKLSKHINDAYVLAQKHHVKADSQEEKVVLLPKGQKAVVIELEGEVPSHFQFYLTDTSKHYLRGALYLIEPTLNDSLRPIVNYMKEDCMHILETLTWTE